MENWEAIYFLLFGLVCVYFLNKSFKGLNFKAIKRLTEVGDDTINQIVKESLNYLSNKYGVKVPNFKVGGIDGKTFDVSGGVRPGAIYSHDLKLIVVDLEYQKSLDYDVHDIVLDTCHEFCHYYDDVSKNMNRDNTLVEILEDRAEDFQKKHVSEVLDKVKHLIK